MQVSQIIGECLTKINGDNFIGQETYTEAQQALIDRLVAALNIAYREITTEYLPLICREDVSLVNGECQTASLNNPILYPVRLERDGVRRAYKTFPSKITSDFSGAAVLTYAYMPSELTFGGEISDLRLTSGILSDGALAQYYFEDKIFELAANYDEKWRAAISKLRFKGREIKIKASRWQV
jgi:hypothetical protein